MFRKSIKGGIIFCLTLLIISLALPAAAAKPKEDKAAKFKEGELIVKFKPGVMSTAGFHKLLNAKVVKKNEQLGFEKVKLTPGMSVEQAVGRYRNNPLVEYAEPNYIFTADMIPNDTLYGAHQWAMPRMNVPSAWDLADGSGVTVAVVDTGVDLDHADLAGNIVSSGYDFITPGTTADDDQGHGTHVAGIIAAVTNNNLGVAGTAFNAGILPVKVLGSDGSGSSEGVADGIRWAADNGADIINLSLGSAGASMAVQDAVDYAYQRGVTVIAAAGNDHFSPVGYPAAFPNAIAVSATNTNDFIAAFSNIGPEVDLGAPGVKIASTYRDNQYVYMDGTSMATPYVSGVAALVLSRFPGLTPAGVKEHLLNSAVDLGGPGKDEAYGYGRVDAYRAVSGDYDEPWETNDSRAAAAVVFNAQTINATISPAGDEDWYKINSVGINQWVAVNASPPPGLDLVIELYNPAGQLLEITDAAAAGGREDLLLQAPGSGTYYVRAREKNSAASASKYSLGISAGGDRYENNNLLEQAAFIANGVINPTIFPAGDHDWYKVTAHDPGTLTVNAAPPANMDAMVYIFDPNSNLVALYDAYYAGGSEGGTIAVSTTGDYYVFVLDYDSSTESDGSYALTVNYQDETAPSITGVTDSPDPVLVGQDSTIAFNLSESCDVSLVVKSGGAAVRTLLSGQRLGGGAQQVVWDGTDANGDTLADGEYTYYLDAADVAGNAAVQQTGTIFVDKTVPQVVEQNPAPGAEAAAVDTAVAAVFSEALDAETVNGSTVQLLQDANPAAASVNYLAPERRVVITPDNPLDGGAVVTVQLTAGIKDARGNALAPTQWQFTTVETVSAGLTVDERGGSLDGGSVRIEVPPGAFDTQTNITVTREETGVQPKQEYGYAGAVFHFSAGAVFTKPLLLEFSYTDADVAGLVETSLDLYYYNEGTGQWEATGGAVDTLNNIVTTSLSHFSQYALMGQLQRYYLATPTDDVYGNSYFNADGVSGYPYEIYLPNEQQPAQYRIHTSYTKDTDACASCHKTHTAVGAGLLQWYSVYDTCMACHDGTVSTTYNVEEGLLPGEAGARTHGGKFGTGKEEFISSHNVRGSLNIAAAPGGSTVTEYEKQADGSMEPVSWGVGFGCESCHSPHGAGGNARILNPDVNGWAKRNKQEAYLLTAVEAGSTVFVAYPAQELSAAPYYMLTGYGYGLTTYVYDGEGNLLDLQPEVDNTPGYTRLVFPEAVTGSVLADFYPSLRVVMDIDNYLQETETVLYREGTSEFCGACHTDYYTASTTRSGSGSMLTGEYALGYRHQVGVLAAESGYQFSQLLRYEEGEDGSRELTCLTCHTAHGVDKQYWQDTIDPERVEGDFWQDDPGTAEVDESHTVEIAGSSALKRMPNMAVCEACHQKAGQNEGYLANSGQQPFAPEAAVDKDYFTIDGAAYVGSGECVDCHAGEYSGWQETRHAEMVGDNGDIVQQAADSWADSEGLAAYGQPADVVYTIGGSRRQMYVFDHGTDGYRVASGSGTAWDVANSQWLDYRDNSETVDWDNTCIACHVTGFNGETGSGAAFKEAGIGCEACHGPGSKHTAYPGEGNIINPGTLAVQQALDVCGQCHAAGDNNGREDFFGFMPGDTLADNFTLHTPGSSPENFWPDGTARSAHMQYQDFTQTGSSHFRTGIITCNTCHDAHGISADGRPLKLTAQQTCGTCHGSAVNVEKYMPAAAASVLSAVYDLRSHAFWEDYDYPTPLDNPSLD